MGFSIKDILKTAAPFLASAFAGPFAPIATAVISKYVTPPNGTIATPDNIGGIIQSALGVDPDITLKLKQAENEFQETMTKMGFDSTEKLEELASSDRDSARKREEVVKDHTPAVLAYVVTLGFFGLLTLFCFRAVPVAMGDILKVMLGSLGAAWLAIVTYYFGSSAGSDSKNKTLADTMDKLGSLINGGK
jgi:hypothetical protein